ncbi:MAG: 4Fe-4S binding protein [Verrucomicrobiales bacterium]|nr:4Fe-4S binding protein [Verrucomicrobiales bacterium]
MNIVTVRRIAQVFFFALFLWFCIVATVGEKFWQLRGWPVNWFLDLDPLAALGTMLTTRELYGGLLWAVLTVVLTIFLGRVFCGWVCPFGAIQQFVGWLARRGRKHMEKVALNKYNRWQVAKYYLLIALLSAAAVGLISELALLPGRNAALWAAALVLLVAWFAWLVVKRLVGSVRRTLSWFVVIVFAWAVVGLVWKPPPVLTQSLQTGLFDPIPLVYRSVNLVLVPLAGGALHGERYYVGAWTIGAVFFGAVFLTLLVPRFYCRFVCPLGAMFGALVRWAPFRIGKRVPQCTDCGLCETDCEGACEPTGKFRVAECVLCFNCVKRCAGAQLVYGTVRSAAGEITSAGVTRRGFLVAAVSGAASVPALRLSGLTARNWPAVLVRPPGALEESEFLDRCIKCGQCMRVCPTNVVQPALLEAGLEGLWTPILNFRIGTSGCQLTCVACSNVCPTGALRPLSLEERLGVGQFEAAGPIRLGTAFIDRGRCLPWAMDAPCLVCQENCPVSPKAIYSRGEFRLIRDGERRVRAATETTIVVDGPELRRGWLGTGEFYLRAMAGDDQARRPIVDNTADSIVVGEDAAWRPPLAPGTPVAIEIYIELPSVDPSKCVGCGVCEHECPVSGLRAIRVTGENATRNKRHSLTARS